MLLNNSAMLSQSTRNHWDFQKNCGKFSYICDQADQNHSL